MARGAWHRALDALLHRLRAARCRRGSSLLPEGHEERLGAAARVQLQVRHVDRFVERHETNGRSTHARTKFHLEPAGHALGPEAPKAAASVTYDALGDGVTFISAPLEHETEITGPLAARLLVSSSTADADLFWFSGCFLLTCGRWCSWARSIRIRRSRKAGCAPRTASSIQGSLTEYRLTYARRPAAMKPRGGAGRNRVVADFDRRPGPTTEWR